LWEDKPNEIWQSKCLSLAEIKGTEQQPMKKVGAISSERFKGQVALVVGGAQGIGRAIAIRLRREGAHVVIADIDRAKMDILSREMASAGTAIQTVICDVRRKRQIERMVAEIVRRHRRVDILMYVAGVAKSVPFIQTRWLRI
jgi:NAD(P)-dependent dehydrogenase (short-subunit alcohol dehydrogenase family)